MLSGAADQLVPKEHMRALWEIVAQRGQKKTSSGAEYKVGLERAKYMEFEFGGHSQLFFSLLKRFMRLPNDCCVIDDTCVQSGYWAAVAEFIASLSDSTEKSGQP